MLSIKDMFRLWRLVGDHLPDEVGDDIVDFVGTIVDSMIKKGQLNNYSYAIELMHNKSVEELKGISPQEGIELFASGLADNKIIAFQSFLKRMEFNE